MFKRINNFKYLSCEIFYENEKDIQQKLAKFVQIVRILNNTFKPTLVHKFSGINVFLGQTLECWALTRMTATSAAVIRVSVISVLFVKE
jgi:transcription termination factor NusB